MRGGRFSRGESTARERAWEEGNTALSSLPPFFGRWRLAQVAPRILIVRFSSLGDILLTTPLVRAIRTAYPAAWITYVTKTSYLPLIEDNPRINEIVGYDPSRSLLPLAN